MIRVVSGAALAVAALAAVLFLPLTLLRVVGCVVAALGAREYAGIVGVRRALEAPLVLAVVVICWWVSVAEPVVILSVLAAVVAATAARVLLSMQGTSRILLGVIAPAYIGMPLGMLVAVQGWRGWQATVLLLATVVVSDSAQYYTGRAWGRTLLAPEISPKKTIEGALGGVVAATGFMIVVGSRVLPDRSVAGLSLLGLGLVVLGVCGDLFESRLKRLAGVKDSSSIIPGHGGVLDRVDALLFATPAFYLYLRSQW